MASDDVAQDATPKARRWSWLSKLALPVIAGAFALWQSVPDGTRSKLIESVVSPALAPSPPTAAGATGAALALRQADEAEDRCDFRAAERVLTQAQQDASAAPELRAKVLLGLVDIALRERYLPMEAAGYLDGVDAVSAGSSELQQWSTLLRGELALRARKLDEAKARFQQVVHSPKAPLAVLANAELGLAQVAVAGEAYADALALLTRAEPGLASTGDQLGQAEALFQRGAIHKAQQAVPQAYKAYRNALELYERQPCKHPKQSFVYCALGDLRQLQRVGDEDARQLYERALALATELRFEVGRAHAFVGLALLDHREGSWAKSRDHFEKALGSYQIVGDLHRQARVHQLWSNLCRDGGDSQCAANHGQVAATMYRELHVEPSPRP